MTATLLIVDDHEDNRCVLQDALEDEGYELHEAGDGVEALESVRRQMPDLILLDVMMPRLDGIETTQRLQADERTKHIPIILVTALNADEHVSEGLDAGATDYVSKPFSGAVVRARVRAALRIKWAQDELLEQQQRAEQLANELALKNEQLSNQATRDSLTGLPNRLLLMDRINRAILRRRRNPSYRFALLFIDFDRFKYVNDTLGHDAGDELLCNITSRLKTTLRSFDTVTAVGGQTLPSRLGGDEFVVLLEDLAQTDDAALVADRLLESLASPHTILGQQVVSTASIGLVQSEGEYDDAEAMLHDADTAMYRAKHAGKARCVEFCESMRKDSQRKRRQEQDLVNALKRDEFEVHYQPIIQLGDGQVMGAEAVARWRHPTQGLIVADSFIPLAASLGLLGSLGDLILNASLQQLASWRSKGIVDDNFVLAVNVWGLQLANAEFVERLRQTLIKHGLKPTNLVLETPETDLLDPTESIRASIDRLRDIGVKLSIDGCGRGHSALTSLHSLPIEMLKIDRSVVANLDSRYQYSAIVQAVITLCHNLGLRVIAVGVERLGQLAQLQALECDLAQGVYFTDALEPGQFAEWCERTSRVSIHA